ncbi:hypothetical protein Y1Q_0024345 [Alligator mississippiensis]|uniref:Uncharacterized protein n=1 Tax=Alligator mississippiensis TaxID=8496 RepID=A0A151NIQ0_ALLMI|nr:hypothetical protein Y1Q_0024345 [Alligator mississippiensis]
MVGLGEWVGVWGSEGAGLSKGWRTIMFLHWLYLGYTQMLRGNDPALQIKAFTPPKAVQIPQQNKGKQTRKGFPGFLTR